jgi:hypothetical protein
LWFGVDDLDGTVQEERIYHMAGAMTPEFMTTSAIRRLIRAAGREPVERDTLYNVITGPEAPDGTMDPSPAPDGQTRQSERAQRREPRERSEALGSPRASV